jgi:hypothetical protein
MASAFGIRIRSTAAWPHPTIVRSTMERTGATAIAAPHVGGQLRPILRGR